MKTAIFISEEDYPIWKQTIFHLYPGIPILVFYLALGPILLERGYTSLLALLLAELLVLTPVELGHMYAVSKARWGGWSWKKLIPNTQKLSSKQYLKWSLLGIISCFIFYMPLYPVGLVLRDSVFGWLPGWFFNPFYGDVTAEAIKTTFIAGIIIDGVVGPVVEELYFRGYLLSRMEQLKKWAPILNGVLFGVYHFWQPHNYLATIAVGIVISYVVWKKRNIYLGIIIHVFLNMFGNTASLMAFDSGEMIQR